jgi:transposase, IS30 family
VGAGTNGNTNGLLREYLPKGTDITGDIRYLNAVADEINGRPVLRSDSGYQQKRSQSFSSLIIPGMTLAQLLPPAETSGCSV